jgi:hypothetical protein
MLTTFRRGADILVSMHGCKLQLTSAIGERIELGELVLRTIELVPILSLRQKHAMLLISRSDTWRGKPRRLWLHALTASALLNLGLILEVQDPDQPDASPLVFPTELGRLLIVVLRTMPKRSDHVRAPDTGDHERD